MLEANILQLEAEGVTVRTRHLIKYRKSERAVVQPIYVGHDRFLRTLNRPEQTCGMTNRGYRPRAERAPCVDVLSNPDFTGFLILNHPVPGG